MNTKRFARKALSFIVVFTFILNQAAYPELLRNRYELRRAASYQDVVPGVSADKFQRSISRLNTLIDRLNAVNGSGDAIERFTENRILAVSQQDPDNSIKSPELIGPKTITVTTNVAPVSIDVKAAQITVAVPAAPAEAIIQNTVSSNNIETAAPLVPETQSATQEVVPGTQAVPQAYAQVEVSAEAEAALKEAIPEEPLFALDEPIQTSFEGLVPVELGESVIVINDIWGLQAIANDLDAHYMLGQDIDASITSSWNDSLGFDP
ncbi:MAG: hypothetical protein JXB40_01475, partial [Candidatus Omnitrophica bacterium]|nr:hypothetical protein [Candidatus Omnitrophota bacterium]